jgi:hypothetical protein
VKTSFAIQRDRQITRRGSCEGRCLVTRSNSSPASCSAGACAPVSTMRQQSAIVVTAEPLQRILSVFHGEDRHRVSSRRRHYDQVDILTLQHLLVVMRSFGVKLRRSGPPWSPAPGTLGDDVIKSRPAHARPSSSSNDVPRPLCQSEPGGLAFRSGTSAIVFCDAGAAGAIAGMRCGAVVA